MTNLEGIVFVATWLLLLLNELVSPSLACLIVYGSSLRLRFSQDYAMQSSVTWT